MAHDRDVNTISALSLTPDKDVNTISALSLTHVSWRDSDYEKCFYHFCYSHYCPSTSTHHLYANFHFEGRPLSRAKMYYTTPSFPAYAHLEYFAINGHLFLHCRFLSMHDWKEKTTSFPAWLKRNKQFSCLTEKKQFSCLTETKQSFPAWLIAQWLEHWTCDRKVVGSNPCRSSGRIFFSRVNFLCWLLFRYPLHPRVTAVARKRPRSLCQKCRWQVTAKHAYTLRM